MTQLKIKLDGTTLSLDGDGVDGNYAAGAGITISGNEISRAAASADVLTIEDHAGNDTLANAESGSVHTNLGAGGTITLTLPDPGTEGVVFTFVVCVAQQLRIDPQTATIRSRIDQTANKYKWADAIGEHLALIADNNGDWVSMAEYVNWNEEV